MAKIMAKNQTTLNAQRKADNNKMQIAERLFRENHIMIIAEYKISQVNVIGILSKVDGSFHSFSVYDTVFNAEEFKETFIIKKVCSDYKFV